MGCFANSTEVQDYEETYCEKCVHNHPEHGCPVIELHEFFQYGECDNPDSILHVAIPRDGEGKNLECIFFMERSCRKRTKIQMERLRKELTDLFDNGL